MSKDKDERCTDEKCSSVKQPAAIVETRDLPSVLGRREERASKHAPQAACTMHREGVEWVVHLGAGVRGRVQL